MKEQKQYYARSSVKGKTYGYILGNTKQGVYKGMNRMQFYEQLKQNGCVSFDILEMKPSYDQHREFLNDKWVSAS